MIDFCLLLYIINLLDIIHSFELICVTYVIIGSNFKHLFPLLCSNVSMLKLICLLIILKNCRDLNNMGLKCDIIGANVIIETSYYLELFVVSAYEIAIDQSAWKRARS